MAAPAPIPAPLPSAAPIPNAAFIASNTLDIKLPPIKLKKGYYIRTQRQKHTLRQQLEAHLRRKYDLTSISEGLLPNERCIFFFIQLVRHNDVDELISKSIDQLPCIAFIPTQGMLCQKTRFAKTMYDYYGKDAWKHTPETFHVCYNPSTQKWQVSNDLKPVLKNVWITKTSTGSLGKNMFLFSGNSLKSLNTFLEVNYNEAMEHLLHESARYKSLYDYEKYINPNAQTLLNSVIIQKYLNKPLLYDTFYKFDIRIYALLATTNPCVLLYKFAKLRICASKFNDLVLQNPVDEEDEKGMNNINITDIAELSKHISNSTMSRGTQGFDRKTSTINGRETLADYDGFIAYMHHMAVDKKQFDVEWFETEEYKKLYVENKLGLKDVEKLVDMKLSRALTAVYDAAKESFDKDGIKYNRGCQFLLQGNDIMIDEKGTFWILEVNQTPTMFKDHDKKIKNLMKDLLKEAIDIVMEIRELKLNGFQVNQYTPLHSVQLWNKGHLNYNHAATDIVDSVINNIDVLFNDNSI